MKKINGKKAAAYFGSVFFILLLWIFLAYLINAELILPYPHQVLVNVLKIASDKVFWFCFFYTNIRMLIAFIISVLAGTFSGFLSSEFSFVKDFLRFPISIIRTTPVIALIVVALFWFSSSSLPVFVAILVCFPIMHSAVENGLCSNQLENTEKLIFMAKNYNLSKWQILKYIKLPACKPSFLSGLENCFGLCWKVTIAGEVISLPSYGFGALMQKYQVHLETKSVIAITIIMVLYSFALQSVISFLIKKGEL